MKVRCDYVSNSSSSSFIVIFTKKEKYEDLEIREKFFEFSTNEWTNEWSTYEFPNKRYKHQFGWEFEDTYDFGGKLNFVGLQLLYLFMMSMDNGESRNYKGNAKEDFTKYYSMVKKVCLEKFGIHVELDTSNIKINIIEGTSGYFRPSFWMDYDMYIDHQSCVTENECMEMFKSEDALYDFLANSESHIEGGNDNV